MRPNIPVLLRNALRAIDHHLATHGRCHGVTGRQMEVLMLLVENPGLTSAQIGRSLLVDKATMAKVMQRLKTKGLIRQGDTKTDARAKPNQLTKAGAEKAKSCREIDTEIQAEVNARVSSKGTFSGKLEAIAAFKK